MPRSGPFIATTSSSRSGEYGISATFLQKEDIVGATYAVWVGRVVNSLSQPIAVRLERVELLLRCRSRLPAAALSSLGFKAAISLHLRTNVLEAVDGQSRKWPNHLRDSCARNSMRRGYRGQRGNDLLGARAIKRGRKWQEMEVRTNRLVNVEQRVALPSASPAPSSQRTRASAEPTEAIVDWLLDRPFRRFGKSLANATRNPPQVFPDNAEPFPETRSGVQLTRTIETRNVVAGNGFVPVARHVQKSLARLWEVVGLCTALA